MHEYWNGNIKINMIWGKHFKQLALVLDYTAFENGIFKLIEFFTLNYSKEILSNHRGPCNMH